ncbi:MAG: pectin methylesterase [Lachnospiraceae bacterium]|nr:pectin methylesterase [Lachnospiraceae bacterium]
MITVALDGSGDYTSLQEAIEAVERNNEQSTREIQIKPGIYKEHVTVLKDDLTITGLTDDPSQVVISWGDYANDILPNGEKRGTFRTSTLLLIASHIHCKNLTVENTAGFGTEVGQAIAVYAEGEDLTFEHCRILGHQDTLFTGPLPFKEAKPGGFIGPTEHYPKVVGHQCYTDCYIEGEVDFIFGSAMAYFENCEIHSLNRNKEINGYVTAASTYAGEKYGYVFSHCRFTSDCPKHTVYLGRPWRIDAKTVLLHCELGEHIHPEGFFDWNKPESHDTVLYAEYQNYGPGADPEHRTRASYVTTLTDEEAKYYTKEQVLGCTPLHFDPHLNPWRD